MEGTGIIGGLALILGRFLLGVPYVVSSGDAVGPFVARRAWWAGPFFAAYERALCRFSAGFIGWTPYLVGRALTFGAQRAMTAAGFAPFHRTAAEREEARTAVRKELGIPKDAYVFGLVGSLVWNRQVRYCYGMELVAARVLASCDVHVLVVGDGTGLPRLRELAGRQLGCHVHLPGRVTQDRVPDYLAAMDVLSLPQSVDRVGSFRFTTKLSEYLAAGSPVVTGQIPLAYDLDDGWLWRLPGDAPWDRRYINALAALMESLTPNELHLKRARMPAAPPEFDESSQVRRVTQFIHDILDR
jgi:glycosyltransferase involved in cell wall biosynthesis